MMVQVLLVKYFSFVGHNAVTNCLENMISEQVEQIWEAAGSAVRDGREEPVHEIQLQHRGCHGDEHDLQGRATCAGLPRGGFP